MIAVFNHELKMYFNSLTAYVFGAFLLVFTGLGAMTYNINASVANFEYVLSYISLVFIIIVPILTMRVIAEEKGQKTDQLLYSLPISTTDVVVGKFFALMLVFILPMVIICFYPLLFANFGDVYLLTSYGAIIGFTFLGMSLISIGMFISSLTESQGFAAGISVVAMLFCYFSSELADYVSSTAKGTLYTSIVLFILIGLILKALTKSNFVAAGTTIFLSALVVIAYNLKPALLEGIVPDFMSKLSVYDRFYTFVNGIFDITALVYYICITVFFLFLSIQSLEKRRYNG